jgi:hypothetical protein
MAYYLQHVTMRAYPTGTSTDFTLNNVQSAAQPFNKYERCIAAGGELFLAGGGVTSAIDGTLTLEAEL